MRIAKHKDGVIELTFRYNADLVTQIKRDFPSHFREWDDTEKCWRVDVTASTGPALRELLEEHFQDNTEAIAAAYEINGLTYKKEERVITQTYLDSFADDAQITVPGMLMEPMPFQRGGIKYMVAKKVAFNGDEMGLGKSLQGIGAVQMLGAFPCLYITKASLKLNMMKEWKKCLPSRRATLEVKEFVKDQRSKYPGCDVLIVNYEQLGKHKELLKMVQWASVIADESQMIASAKAARTKHAKEIVKATKPPVRYCLTGTPLDSKPIQLWSQLEFIGLAHHFKSWYHFVTRYCEGFEGNWGWDTSGASNILELHHKLREIGFIGRTKDQVMKDLPPKTFVPIFVEIDNWKEYNDKKREIDQEIAKDNEVAALQRLAVLSEVACRGKMTAFKEWLEDFHESGKKLVTFAHAISVQHAAVDAMKALGKTVYTRAGVAQDAVDAFQEDPATWGIVCSLEADHAGHTLTKASDVAMLQTGFRPSIVDQAGDRTHRIGQKNAVTVYCFVAVGTVEEEVWDIHQRKRAVRKGVQQGIITDTDDSSVKELLRKFKG